MKNPIKYPSYKDSDVEWLHEIPSHWKIVKAKRIFHEISIKNHPDEPLLAATQTKGVIPKSLYENTTVTATKNFETLKFVRKGDFVISLRSFQGGIEYAHYQGIISPAYTILEPQEEVVHKYYRYLLKSKHYISGLTLLVTGIREGQNIDTGKFKDSFLPLPPKLEQTKIAAFLDFKLAKIDRFIRKKKQLIKLLNEQKAAIINQAVTKGLNPDAKMKPSGIEWLGDIPEHWEVGKLKYLTTKIVDGIHSTPEYDDNGSFPFINGNNFVAGEVRITARTRFVNQNEYDKYSIKLKPNSILISINGTIGNKAIYKNEDVVFGKSAAFIEFKEVDFEVVDFVFNLLGTKYVNEYFISTFQGTTINNLSLFALRNTPIILPKSSEISQILKYLKTEIAKLNQTISTIEKEIALTQEYKTALIAEAVTGKIDVRDYDIPEIVEEESYEELEEELSLGDEVEEDYNSENE